MRGKSDRQDLHYLKIAVFGMVIISLGIGQFFYTLVFLVILDEGLFSFNQLSYIASANCGGYLVGCLFFSLCRFGNISRTSYMLSGTAIVTSALNFCRGVNNKVLFGFLNPLFCWYCKCSNDDFLFYYGYTA
ncbi:hypothetical protein ABID23_000817 [Bartonella silvatica]|uniref:Nodulin-like domain-containing protein n=1 Tax=Bartonella silvatica TaxID=357760 RepID=A0ABV2HGQ8_9HYPH